MLMDFKKYLTCWDKCCFQQEAKQLTAGQFELAPNLLQPQSLSIDCLKDFFLRDRIYNLAYLSVNSLTTNSICIFVI